MSEVEIRLAVPEDVDLLVGMFAQVQQWLAAKGSEQWALSDLKKVRGNFSSSVESGECYLALRGGKPVGTITVDEHANLEFWQSSDDPSSALYVRRMVVTRAAAGEGVGAELLRWALQLAAKRGRRWLRLDAWRTSTALHDYYVRQGFSHVRTVNVSQRGSGALFQCPVETTR